MNKIMNKELITIRLDGLWYIIPKNLLPEKELNKFKWKEFKGVY